MTALWHRVLSCGTLLLAASAANAAPTASVADIKAAYLVKFGPFIEWKNAAPSSPFVICTFGEDDVSKALDGAAKDQTVGDAPVSIRHLAAGQPADGCRILYFAEGGPPNDYPSVLTVTETEQTPHGVISFVIADKHVRFDIDLQMAGKAGLDVSAKLLGLARTVRGAP